MEVKTKPNHQAPTHRGSLASKSTLKIQRWIRKGNEGYENGFKRPCQMSQLQSEFTTLI